MIVCSQILVFGVNPTFRFYCIMRSFQLIKVLVCPEETALVSLEETVLRLKETINVAKPGLGGEFPSRLPALLGS